MMTVCSFEVLWCFPSGTSWVEVESPVKEVEALHVAVGVSVVWVVSKDFKVNQQASRVAGQLRFIAVVTDV